MKRRKKESLQKQGSSYETMLFHIQRRDKQKSEKTVEPNFTSEIMISRILMYHEGTVFETS